MHLNDNGRKKVSHLHYIICNRDINLSAGTSSLLSVIRPSIGYGSDIWDGNKCQADALVSIVLGEPKGSLGALLKLVMRQLEGTWT